MKHCCFKDIPEKRMGCVGRPHMYWYGGYVLWRSDGSKLRDKKGKNIEVGT